MTARIGWCARSSTPSTAGDERSFISLGMILASAFPAILVYAQELMPGNTGTVAR